MTMGAKAANLWQSQGVPVLIPWLAGGCEWSAQVMSVLYLAFPWNTPSHSNDIAHSTAVSVFPVPMLFLLSKSICRPFHFS